MKKEKCSGNCGDQKRESQNLQRGGTDVQVSPGNHRTWENLPGSAQRRQLIEVGWKIKLTQSAKVNDRKVM